MSGFCCIDDVILLLIVILFNSIVAKKKAKKTVFPVLLDDVLVKHLSVEWNAEQSARKNKSTIQFYGYLQTFEQSG